MIGEMGNGDLRLGNGESVAGMWHGRCCKYVCVNMAWELLQLFSACQKKLVDMVGECAILLLSCNQCAGCAARQTALTYHSQTLAPRQRTLYPVSRVPAHVSWEQDRL
jgi:hypothetical protein